MRFSVDMMCKVLKVSKSAYYHWLDSSPSRLWLENQKISELIRSIFKESSQTYV